MPVSSALASGSCWTVRKEGQSSALIKRLGKSINGSGNGRMVTGGRFLRPCNDAGAGARAIIVDQMINIVGTCELDCEPEHDDRLR